MGRNGVCWRGPRVPSRWVIFQSGGGVRTGVRLQGSMAARSVLSPVVQHCSLPAGWPSFYRPVHLGTFQFSKYLPNCWWCSSYESTPRTSVSPLCFIPLSGHGGGGGGKRPDLIFSVMIKCSVPSFSVVVQDIASLMVRKSTRSLKYEICLIGKTQPC